MMKTRQLNIRVTPDVRQALEAIRERDGVPLGEQIRRGILLWLAAKAPKHSKAARS